MAHSYQTLFLDLQLPWSRLNQYCLPILVVMESDYADDLAVMDNTEEGLQEFTIILSHITPLINAKKTQCMAISKCASQRPYTERDSIMLTVEGEPVEQVSNFVYLGANISGDGTIDRDLEDMEQ